MPKKNTIKSNKNKKFDANVQAGGKQFSANVTGYGDSNPVSNPWKGQKAAGNRIQSFYRDMKVNARTKQALKNANYRNKRLNRQILSGGAAVAEASAPWADALKEKWSAPYKYAPSSVSLYEGKLGKTEDEALPKTEEESGSRWPR